MAELDQTLDERRADEAGGTRDQNTHETSLPKRLRSELEARMQGDVLVSDEILGGEAPAKKRGARERLLAVAIVAAGLGAFIVQNTDSTPVTWLIFTGSAPLWAVIVLAAVAGAVLSELGGYLIRRRRQRAN